MSRSDEEKAAEKVRVGRVEIVDERGRVRATLGPIESPETGRDIVGLVLLDRDGEPRVSVGVDDGGAWAAFEIGGNALVHLGVNEAGSDAVDARAFVHLADAHGVPVIGWRVADDGSLIEQRRS